MPVSYFPYTNIPHSTQMLQVIRDPRGSGAEDPEGEYDSDSDYEDTVEGTPASTQEDTGCDSKREPKPGVSATLTTGAFPT